MRVNHNITAMLANNTLSKNYDNMSGAIQRLSSGYRVNHAKDDSAGMAISQKMRTQIRNIQQANRNAGDGISVVETAEGAMNEMHAMLQRMKELAVKAANDTNCAEDRITIQDEINVMLEEFGRISQSTQFNNQHLLNGDIGRATYIDTGSVIKGLKQLEISDAVKNQEYEITVEQDARQAVIVAGSLTMSETDTITADQAGTITMNGETIEIKEGDSAAVVYDKIKELSSWTGNTAFVVDSTTVTPGETEFAGYTPSTNTFGNGGQLVFASNWYGSEEKIEIKCSNADLANILGLSTTETVANGLDAKVQLGAGFSPTATTTVNGNKITVKDSSGFLMVMEAKQGACETAFSDVTIGSTDTEATASGGASFDSKVEVLDAGQMVFQIGANEQDTMTVTIPAMTTKILGLDDINVVCGEDARAAVTKVDEAIKKVSDVRAKIGAYQNRLEHTEANLAVYEESMTASLSRIMDSDMAEEMTDYTQRNLLTQTATSMLAKANTTPEGILQLLQR